MNVYTANESTFTGGYHWKFTTRFRLNKSGVIDSYYDEPLSACLFWLEMNAKGKWELRGTDFYFDDFTDATFFRVNFDDVIRHITESADQAERRAALLQIDVDDDDELSEPSSSAIIIEVDEDVEIVVING
jgi:hypothetical protein